MDGGLERELTAFLSGDETAHIGVIGGLVQRAEAEAVRRHVPSGARAMPIPKTRHDETQAASTAMQCDVSSMTPAPDKDSPELPPGHPSVTSDQRTPGPNPAHRTEAVEAETEYLEDFGRTRGAAAAEKPELQAACETALPICTRVFLSQAVPLGAEVAGAASDAARRFMGWVQQGLADGSLRNNEAAALVHFVDEGMLLVSPRIFKEFARRFGEDGHGCVGAAGDDAHTGKSIQRQVLRAGWHVQADNGINILAYQVMRGRRAVSRLCGVVIKSPGRFVNPVPSANPVLVRLPATTAGA